MNEVRTNTTDKMPNMIANIPEMTFVKYNAAITTAMSMRIALSAVPIFFFIITFIYCLLPDLHFSTFRHLIDS